MGNEDATIARSLERTKDSRAGGGAFEANIQVCLEWPGSVLIIEGLSHGNLAGRLLHTFVLIRKREFGECPAGDEKAGSIGSCPVGETVVDAVAGKFFGASRSEDKVSLQTGVDYLANNFLVGEADNKTVLGSITIEDREDRFIELRYDYGGCSTYYLFLACVTRRLRA